MDILQFTNALSGGGARANLYQVRCTFPAWVNGGEVSNKMKYLVKATSLPASTIGTIEQAFMGQTAKLAGDRTNAEWTFTVLNDTDFAIRNAFERWQNGIRSFEDNRQTQTDIYGTVEVDQLDSDDNVIKTYTLKMFWPTEVGAIDLAHDSSNQIEEFTVTGAFSKCIPSGL